MDTFWVDDVIVNIYGEVGRIARVGWEDDHSSIPLPNEKVVVHWNSQKCASIETPREDWKVLDRALCRGDMVVMGSNRKGKIGTIINVETFFDVSFAYDNTLNPFSEPQFRMVPSKLVKSASDWTYELVVAKNGWAGTVTRSDWQLKIRLVHSDTIVTISTRNVQHYALKLCGSLIPSLIHKNVPNSEEFLACVGSIVQISTNIPVIQVEGNQSWIKAALDANIRLKHFGFDGVTPVPFTYGTVIAVVPESCHVFWVKPAVSELVERETKRSTKHHYHHDEVEHDDKDILHRFSEKEEADENKIQKSESSEQTGAVDKDEHRDDNRDDKLLESNENEQHEHTRRRKYFKKPPNLQKPNTLPIVDPKYHSTITRGDIVWITPEIKHRYSKTSQLKFADGSTRPFDQTHYPLYYSNALKTNPNSTEPSSPPSSSSDVIRSNHNLGNSSSSIPFSTSVPEENQPYKLNPEYNHNLTALGLIQLTPNMLVRSAQTAEKIQEAIRGISDDIYDNFINDHRIDDYKIMQGENHESSEESSPNSADLSVNQCWQDADPSLCHISNLGYVLASYRYVDVQWQDGTITHRIHSSELCPLLFVGDSDFQPGEYVFAVPTSFESLSLGNDFRNQRLGIIQSVDHDNCVCTVKWTDTMEFEPHVSIYLVESSPSRLEFRVGYYVVRRLTGDAETFDGTVGIVEEVSIDGKLKITWVEGTIGWYFPHQVSPFRPSDFAQEEGDIPDLSVQFDDLEKLENEVKYGKPLEPAIDEKEAYHLISQLDDLMSDHGDESEEYEEEEGEEDEEDEENEEDETEDEEELGGEEESQDENPEVKEDTSIPLKSNGLEEHGASGKFNFNTWEKSHQSVEASNEKGEQNEDNSIPNHTIKQIDDILLPRLDHGKPSGVAHIASEISGTSQQEHHRPNGNSETDDTQNNTDVDDSIIAEEDLWDSEAMGYHSRSNFRTLAFPPKSHHFNHESPIRSSKFSTLILKEWRILSEASLDGVYVIAYDNRIELFRFIIRGTSGTPFYLCWFLFDLILPEDYPYSPPKVFFHSLGPKLHPNLYENGDICLSLLGTWSGEGSENWDPNHSNVLQVILSIQGLILGVQDPYFLEAGYDKYKGRSEADQSAILYNERSFFLSIQRMKRLMDDPPAEFKEIVLDSFVLNSNRLMELESIINSKPLLPHDENPQSTSSRSTSDSNQVNSSTSSFVNLSDFGLAKSHPSIGFLNAFKAVFPTVKQSLLKVLSSHHIIPSSESENGKEEDQKVNEK